MTTEEITLSGQDFWVTVADGIVCDDILQSINKPAMAVNGQAVQGVAPTELSGGWTRKSALLPDETC